MITLSDFKNIELRVGTVLEAHTLDNSEKLIKLIVSFGEENPRQILTGMKQWKSAESFIGNQYLFIANLEYRTMMGFESQGMILAVDGENNDPVLLVPEEAVPLGAKVR